MKRIYAIVTCFAMITQVFSQTGKVGINTTSPLAMLHVKDSSVVFSGLTSLPGVAGNPAISGQGIRMMWYPDKAAFRSGYVSSVNWDKDSIGNYSFAAGNNTRAKGIASAAMGFSTIASGIYSFATGEDSRATGIYSTALGFSTTASGSYSTALNHSAIAGGDFSTAMGAATYARAFNSLSIGRYNDFISGSSSTDWVDTDPLFIIGNGTSSGNRRNAFIIAKNGKTGINVANEMPLAMLHVKDSSVLFSGGSTIQHPSLHGDPPVSGAGVRMMWYADKGSFRAGYVSGNQWDKELNGNASFATGSGTIASGAESAAFGLFTEAAGSNSFATGYQSKANGTTSFSGGLLSIASGTSSVSWGEETIASGDKSFSIGLRSTASGELSFSTGYETKAAGMLSATLGYQTTATGYSTFVQGFGASASGSRAVAMGQYTASRSYASLAIGQYNDSISSASQNSWINTDPAFIIGNGAANDARRNAFIVAKNGETGINVANGMPQALLHLKAKEATYDMHIRLENVSNSDYASVVYDGDMKFRTFGAGDVYQWRNSTNNTRMTLDDLGNLTIAGIYSPSDARLKKNIAMLRNSLQKLSQLSGYHYNWIDKTSDASLQTGLLAQEVEKQMPELVKTDKDGVKSVNYNGMIPYLIEAMKQQQQKIESLEKELVLIRELLIQKGTGK